MPSIRTAPARCRPQSPTNDGPAEGVTGTFQLTPQPAREADLLRFALLYLRACRIAHWRSNVVAVAATDAQGRRRYVHGLPKGFPDISGLLPGGRALFVEVKSLKGTLTRHQVECQANLRTHGALVLTIKSIDDLRQGLRDAGLTVP